MILYFCFGTFVASSVLAAGPCLVSAGLYGFERAVKVGKTTSYFRPSLQIEAGAKAMLINDSAGNSRLGFCKAMGHAKAYSGSLENSEEQPYTFMMDSNGEVFGMYSVCRESCPRIVVTLTCGD